MSESTDVTATSVPGPASAAGRRRRVFLILVISFTSLLVMTTYLAAGPAWLTAWLRRQSDASDPTFILSAKLVGLGDRLRAYPAPDRDDDRLSDSLQWPDGHWDVDGIGPDDGLPPGRDPLGDLHVTALQLLCYLGAGYDQRMPSRHRRRVASGLTFLLDADREQLLDRHIDVYAWCCMAICEAYAMTNDPDLRTPAQTAIDTLRARQTPRPTAVHAQHSAWPGGWHRPGNQAIDTALTLPCLMAIKSGKAGGLEVGDSLDRCETWLKAAWASVNPEDMDPYDPGTFPSSWHPVTGITTPADRLTPIAGLVAGAFLGKRSGDVLMDSLANTVVRDRLRQERDPYLNYLTTLGLFQYGGSSWTTWQAEFREPVITEQRQYPICLRGTWDPVGPPSYANGHRRTRRHCTTLRTLALEVYYRRYPFP